MKHLIRLTLAFTLMFVLATAAFAGETNSPPGETSTPPCVPGETASPPCSSQSAPGETLAPPVDVTDITQAVLFALSLF